MKTLSAETLSQMGGRMLPMFAMRNIGTDSFYRTGFEKLYFEADHEKMSEVLISSVIPFDGELLIVGDSEMCKMWRMLCHKMSISVSVIDGQDTENEIDAAMTAIMESNKRIKHVICSGARSAESLSIIGRLSKKYRCALIVDNCTDVLSMADVDRYGIDFLIGSSNDDLSVILARRSKLVQTEGNARNASQDLYAMWQDDMRQRRPTLEPMAC